MKMKFINKILVSFLAASTIYAVSGVVFANPKKHLCSLQNIYDLKDIIEQDKEAFKNSITKSGDSILSILENNTFLYKKAQKSG